MWCGMHIIWDSAVVQRARALAMKYNCMRMLCVCEGVEIGWVGLRGEEIR